MEFDYKSINDFAMRRQFESLTDKGMGVLSESKIKKVSRATLFNQWYIIKRIYITKKPFKKEL